MNKQKIVLHRFDNISTTDLENRLNEIANDGYRIIKSEIDAHIGGISGIVVFELIEDKEHQQ